MAKAGASNDNHENDGGAVEKLTKGKGVMMNGENDKGDEIMDHKRRKHELRVSRERGRTRKMAKLYADLHALLPNLPTEPKADKATIVKEAMNSIKSLEQTLQNLQKQKQERLQGHVSNNNTSTVVPLVPSQNLVINNNDHEPLLVNQQQLGSSNIFETWTSPNVTISMCGTDAHISICSLKKPGLFTTICLILKNHNHEIVSAQISSDDAKTMYMIHVRANVHPEFAEGFPYQEMYKIAAEQIMLWINFEKLQN